MKKAKKECGKFNQPELFETTSDYQLEKALVS